MRSVDAARIVGMARAACEYAIKYSQERVAFGKPIGHFQSLAFLMSDMSTEVNAARWLVWRAGWAVDANHPNAHAMVSKAVAQANEMALFVTNNAVQILGGHGFIQDHPVEKWMRDARSHSILFGQTHLQRMIIAREALEKGGKA
jgi:alkylation response protein AidB-like acyl-CoA dehydrogenase